MIKFIVVPAISILALMLLLIFFRAPTTESVDTSKDSPQAGNGNQNSTTRVVGAVEELTKAKSSEIQPTGDLAEMFSLGSDFTDLQRDLKFKEIRGKVVEWTLPVYEVKQSGDGYTIQTAQNFRGKPAGERVVGTLVRLTARDQSDREIVNRLKTGDVIQIRGVIDAVTMRNLELKPAIFFDGASVPTVVVKIGSAAPLTGWLAHLGEDNENGVRLAIDEANAKNLTIDGKKIKFEMMGVDDEANPTKGPIVAQKMIDAKVAGVVGHLSSRVTILASDVYNKAGIPMISGSVTHPKLTERGFKVTFRTVGRDDHQGPAIASYLAAEVKPKTVAVIDDSTAYGEGLADEVEKTFKAAGVAVLPREKGTKKTTDWKAHLTKIKGKKPDAIFFGGIDAAGGPLMKQGRKLGIKAVFAFGDGACTDKMKELAGDAAEGLLCSQVGLPVQAANKSFLENYKKKFNVDPILYAPFTFDAANLLIAAMQKANSTDPVKYLPALAAISYDGASGRIEFDAKGDRKDAEMTIFTMKGGKIEPVAIIKGGKSTKFDEFIAKAGSPGVRVGQ